MQKPRRFRGFHSLTESRTSNQLPDQGPNYHKILRENRVLMVKATQNPTQFASFLIRGSLG